MKQATATYWRLSSFYFLYFALLGALLPYFSLYLDAVGRNAVEIGILSSLILVTRIFAPTLWGWLADRSGRRVLVIQLGCLLTLVSFCGVFLGNSFAWLALVISLFSLFWNAVLPQYEAVTLATLGPQSHRYGQVRAWGSISFILVVLFGGVLFDRISVVHFPWLMTGLLVALALGSLTVRAPRGQVAAGEHGQLGTILRRPLVLGFFACCVLMLLSHGPFYTFFSLYLQDYGYSRTWIGLFWSISVIVEILLFLLVHRVFVHVSLRHVILASLALAALRWLLTAWFAHSLAVLVFAQVLHAATYGAFHAAGILLVQEVFGHRHQGQGQALYSSVSFGVGGALGAWLSGLVWDRYPEESFLGAAFVALLAWCIALRWVRGPETAVLSSRAESRTQVELP